MIKPIYQRILLKLSGEALMSENGGIIDADIVKRLAIEIKELCDVGIQVGLVIGGGNILRGAEKAAQGLDRVTSDQMGMLATVINALAMQDALEANGQQVRVMSALKINQVCEDYIRRRAVRHLEKVEDAVFYSRLTYDEALDQRLNVMDTTALVLCRDNNVPMRVMNIFEQGAVMRLMMGEEIGSLIERGTSL